MRKNTKGRNNQHIPACKAREAQVGSPARVVKSRVPNPANKSGYSVKTTKIAAIPAKPAIPAMGGRCIKHDPNRPSQAMIAGKASDKPAAYVNWKECEGAKRRKWS